MILLIDIFIRVIIVALEEVNIYKKNNKALCDVLTLYGYFLEKNNSYLLEKNNNLVSYMLVDNVIKDLEDKEVDIPLKGKSIKKLVEKDQEIYDSLKNRGINLSRDYRFNEVCNYYGNDSSYDIVSCIFKSNESFVSDILCSDIPIDKRVDILYEFMLSIINSYDLGFYMFKSILSVKGPGTKNKINSIKKQEKIEELLESFKKMLKDNYDKKEKLVLTILNSIKQQIN